MAGAWLVLFEDFAGAVFHAFQEAITFDLGDALKAGFKCAREATTRAALILGVSGRCFVIESAGTLQDCAIG